LAEASALEQPLPRTALSESPRRLLTITAALPMEPSSFSGVTACWICPLRKGVDGATR
jgi:hypothetical protein